MSNNNFNAAFAFLQQHGTPRLEVQPDWNNGTGYFNGAAKLPAYRLMPGSLAIAIDQHNRRLILIGTALGNIVFFDRYDPTKGDSVVVVNYPDTVIDRIVGGGGSVDEDTIERVLGHEHEGYKYNLGYYLQQVLAKVGVRDQEEEEPPVQNTRRDSDELGKPISLG